MIAQPFSAFEYDADDDAWVFTSREVVAKLAFGTGEFFVLLHKTSLASLDLANGVSVDLILGDATATENIAIAEAPGRKFIYQRPE